MSATSAVDRADEHLEGAEAICGFLKASGFKDMTAKKVYRLKETGAWPIVCLPGMGLVARASELQAYIEQAFKRGASDGDRQKAPVENKDRHIRSVGR